VKDNPVRGLTFGFSFATVNPHQRGNEMNNGTYWKQMKECHKGEPITENVNFDYVIELMIAQMETGRNTSMEGWSLLMEGAEKYMNECKEVDETFGRTKFENENWTEAEEIEQDRAERNSDLIKSEIIANTESIYGVRT